jgi:hypothetical protein
VGVAALILGILAILLAPFGGLGGVLFGLLAVVFGIVARRAAERDGRRRGAATAGVVTGLCGLVLGACLFALFQRCAAAQAEAGVVVDEIARRQMASYEAQRRDALGQPLPRTFASVRAVPARVPCQRRPVTVAPEEWRAAGWEELGFVPRGPVAFQFLAEARGVGRDARVIVVARADLDCDGTLADLRRRVAVDAAGRPFLAGSPRDWRHAIGISSAPGPLPGPWAADRPEDWAPPWPARRLQPRSPTPPAPPAGPQP